MGRPKQLIALDGEPLVRRAAQVLLDGGVTRLRVVVGHQAETVAAALDSVAARCLRFEGWEAGMGASIAFGVRSLAEEGAPVPLLLAVADQPGLEPDHVAALLEPLAQADAPDAVASVYAGRRAVPAAFGPICWPWLMRLEGDQGARDWLRSDRLRVAEIEWPPGARDLDRPEDLDPHDSGDGQPLR